MTVAMTPGTEPADAADAGRVAVLTEPLGGSALSRWIQSGDAPKEWNLRAPGDPAGWRTRIAGVQAQFTGASWLQAIGDAISPTGTGRERLERVARAGGVIVTTGQQPGLFGGPIYTWSKAVTALALADLIEETLGVPAAPLFWAATDDADLIEAQSVWLAMPTGAARVDGEATAPAGTPAARVPQGDLSAQLALLRSAAGSAADSEILAVVERAYGDPRRTVGDAYLQVLEATVGALGIPVLDASHPAVRRAASGLLRHALAAHDSVERALAQRAHEIRAAGHDPQVEEVPGLTPVFLHDATGAKRRVSAAEARSVADMPDADLGPNVLLRPIVEAALLPTVTYVAGPGELAYFAQVTAVADALAVRSPLAVPRWSCSLDEPRMRRVLERLGVSRAELADPHRVETTLARAAMPGELRGALERMRATFDAAVDDTARADTTGLLPASVIDGLRARVGLQLDRFERRAVAATKRREEGLMRDIARVRGFYHPGGKRQERALSIIPTLARYGTGTLETMRHAAREHASRLLGCGT